MKLKKLLPRLGLLAVLFSTLTLQPFSAQAQGTAFTYQGVLNDGGTPATGVYDLRFRLFNALTNGAQVGGQIIQTVPVTNGLFTVTLDFGSQFSGNDRWMQIAVRPGTNGTFTILDPRQPLTPVPYAIYSGGADAGGVTGTLPTSALTGVALNATNLTSGTVPDARLSTNVALRAGGNSFTGPQVFTNAGASGFSVRNPNGRFNFTGFAPNPDGTTVTAGLVGSDTNWPRLRFEREAGGTFMDIGQNANGDLQVKASGTERLTVMNNGNVGVGTTTPTDKLVVAGGGTELHVVPGNLNGVVNPNAVTLEIPGVKTLGIQDSLRVQDDLSVDGYVGIGTTTPVTALHVAGAGSTEISVESTTSNRRWTLQATDDEGEGRSGAFQIVDRTVDAQRLIITTNGNVGIGSITPATALDVAGEVTCTAVNITSDRNAKEVFTPVNARAILAKVAALPITEWQYKTQGDARHIGPMAQDFHAAFGTGRDEKHITSVDADGVALAAIQGLNAKVDEKDARIQELEKSLAELKELVRKLAAQGNGGAR